MIEAPYVEMSTAEEPLFLTDNDMRVSASANSTLSIVNTALSISNFTPGLTVFKAGAKASAYVASSTDFAEMSGT